MSASLSALRYLTVQDVLWMNLQITRKVEHFSHARLEEATFYQYAYGEVKGVPAQAARLLSGFSRLKPFEGENDATALLAALVFLEFNNHRLDVADAELLAWAQAARTSLAAARRSIETHAQGEHPHEDGPAHVAGVKEIATEILSRYPKTFAAVLPVKSEGSATSDGVAAPVA